jgi:hypothetical protein
MHKNTEFKAEKDAAKSDAKAGAGYESPSIEDLGSFIDLTQTVSVLNMNENPTQSVT